MKLSSHFIAAITMASVAHGTNCGMQNADGSGDAGGMGPNTDDQRLLDCAPPDEILQQYPDLGGYGFGKCCEYISCNVDKAVYIGGEEGLELGPEEWWLSEAVCKPTCGTVV